ncbi:ladderlectin-like [Danio aesculapii]|uniref:ladderlectin-like n=1 Tax=Danio aesculapii TaxID=1142201 RepID=UPI0024C01CCF|nr:ladderlectin-like [Danio aesculapii]
MAILRRLMFFVFIFSSAAGQDEKCPCGWKNSGSRCLKFFSESVNWITAERNCQSLGANLASMQNKVENDFLLSLVPRSTRCWIGGHDGEQEGQWLWTDGSVYGYTNWCPEEPNNKRIENCLEINWTSNRCWNDQSCSTLMGYLCGKKL